MVQVFWRCCKYSCILLSVVSFQDLLYHRFSFESVYVQVVLSGQKLI